MKVLMLSIAALLLVLAAACSSDDNNTSGGTTTQTKSASQSPSVCAEKDAVEAAVTDLANVDVVAEGTNALKASVDDLKTEVDDLKKVVSSDVADEVDGLEKAVSDAQNTLSGIKDDATLSQKTEAVTTALTGIANASSALVNALKSECT